MGAARKAMRRKKAREILERAFREEREQLEPQADPHYDFSAHEDGTLAAYSRVYPKTGLLALHHDGVSYALCDQWCVRPGCPCVDGVVDVLVVPPDEASGGVDVLAEFLGAIHYPSGDAVERSPKPPPALVAAVLGADYRAPLAARRERLRAEAARRWPAPRATARSPAPPPRLAASAPTPTPPSGEVGRNERCPCGSGKKFKQCCLRKR
jgi:hypothetical protein